MFFDLWAIPECSLNYCIGNTAKPVVTKDPGCALSGTCILVNELWKWQGILPSSLRINFSAIFPSLLIRREVHLLLGLWKVIIGLIALIRDLPIASDIFFLSLLGYLFLITSHFWNLLFWMHLKSRAKQAECFNLLPHLLCRQPKWILQMSHVFPQLWNYTGCAHFWEWSHPFAHSLHG